MRKPRHIANNKSLRELSKDFRKIKPSSFPKHCTCGNHTWHGIPGDAKFNDAGIWINCPECGSTALIRNRGSEDEVGYLS